jgi:hypothetical protein
MADARLLAIAALGVGFGLACANPPAPRCEESSEIGRIARVEVALAPDASGLAPEEGALVVAVVRQSALDWLEQQNRLAPDGQLALVVTIDSARLRSGAVTWLFAWAAAPDHLAAQVVLERGHARDPTLHLRCPVRVESALAGYSWRDPDARLARLARRLGRRIAEGL